MERVKYSALPLARCGRGRRLSGGLMPTISDRVRLVGWAKARPSKYSALANSRAPCPRARLSAWAKSLLILRAPIRARERFCPPYSLILFTIIMLWSGGALALDHVRLGKAVP